MAFGTTTTVVCIRPRRYHSDVRAVNRYLEPKLLQPKTEGERRRLGLINLHSGDQWIPIWRGNVLLLTDW